MTLRFNPAQALDSFFGDAQRAAGEVARGVEDAACDAWKAVLPPPLQQALRATQVEPWRSIQRAISFTAPSMIPYTVMPFTLPLVLVFYPLLIWFETTRLTVAVLANCMRVSTTMRNEATDLLALIDSLSPSTPQGRLARTALSAVGAGQIVELYDVITPSARGVLTDIKNGRPLDLNDVGGLARAALVASGDAELLETFDASGAAMNEIERDITTFLDDAGALAQTAAVTSPIVVTDIQVTRPDVAERLVTSTKKEVDAVAVIGTVSAALGIAAAVNSLRK